MIIHLKDYVNKLRNYSEKLDNFTLLIDQPWKTGIIENTEPATFIFRKENNELPISKAGNVEKGKWDYISSMNALMLEMEGKTTLYKQGFFDDSVLILQREGTDEYSLFINENKIDKTIDKLEQASKQILHNTELRYSSKSSSNKDKETSQTDSSKELTNSSTPKTDKNIETPQIDSSNEVFLDVIRVAGIVIFVIVLMYIAQKVFG